MKKIILDDYEQEIEQALDEGRYKSVDDVQKEIKKYTTYFKDSKKKNKSITIRIAAEDLEKLQKKANKNGLPYQTLLNTLIRQYTSNKIKIEL